ncbi:helix-turn-helix domain-containing protein [Moraxella bovoculi]
MIATLKHTRGNQSKTTKLLDLNRDTLCSKLKAHGLL